VFSFFNKNKWPIFPLDEIKKRARIVVIDDNEFPYAKLFKSDGYNLDKWKDVDDLPKLESGYYDLILLDMHGVGLKQSAEQGHGILKHLRKVCPAQIVIAYSNADWSLKFQEFFDLADNKLDKRQDYVDFKRAVDDQLKARFSMGFYVSRVGNILRASNIDEAKLAKACEKSILSNDTNKLRQFLGQTVDGDLVQVAIGIIQIAIALSAGK